MSINKQYVKIAFVALFPKVGFVFEMNQWITMYRGSHTKDKTLNTI